MSESNPPSEVDCGSEWSGGKADESGQRCGGTVLMLGATTEPKCQLGEAKGESEIKKATANAVRVRAPARSDSDEDFAVGHHHFPRLTPRLKLSANLNGWMARKLFDNLRRPPRARGSERHADHDVHQPVKACRCWRCGGVSRRRQHERQAHAHAPIEIHQWTPCGGPPGAFVMVERNAEQSAN